MAISKDLEDLRIKEVLATSKMMETLGGLVALKIKEDLAILMMEILMIAILEDLIIKNLFQEVITIKYQLENPESTQSALKRKPPHQPSMVKRQ